MPPMRRPLPPRPDAVATFLATDDFLPGVQTLLYSIKKTLKKREYAPELVVLVTKDVSASTRAALHPVFCTRIVEVDYIPAAAPTAANEPSSSSSAADSKKSGDVVANGNGSHVAAWDAHCGYTKLHIFRLDVYGTLLYVDADCLVVKDVGHLLDLGLKDAEDGERNEGTPTARSGLLAAAPDVFPPDRFNAGVLVVKPSASLFQNMMDATKRLGSYDGGDTGFLNAFFPEWHRDMPSTARLGFGYNAQRFLHRCTNQKRPQYWDEAVKPSLHIVHYSSSPKPWESTDDDGDSYQNSADARSHLDEKSARAVADTRAGNDGELEKMWREKYRETKRYFATSMEKLARKKRRSERSSHTAGSAFAGGFGATKASSRDDVDSKVRRRYKELRKTGMGTKEAMSSARAEYGQDKNDHRDPRSTVAQMFGMM